MPDDNLLDQALSASDPADRREAFVELVRSDAWEQVLAPHVISRQGYQIGGTLYPDWATFSRAAQHAASHADKVERCLELGGVRFADELLYALARVMGPRLVEPALRHLRDAEGQRAALLLRILRASDRRWLHRDDAAELIRRHLQVPDSNRIELMQWLAESGAMHGFVDMIRVNLPVALEEWSAMGKAQLVDEEIFHQAMAILPYEPSPIVYLLRLDGAPEVVAARIMAAARSEWVIAALETAIVDGLKHPYLIPLAEVGVRLGGRCLAVATAWVNSAGLARDLLSELTDQISDENGRAEVNDMLWIRRKAPSADRALERGGRNEAVDARDAAALVRQLRGDRITELVREIIEKPLPTMVEPVLRPLCAVSSDAAREVTKLCDSDDAGVKTRARQARAWPDVVWPGEG